VPVYLLVIALVLMPFVLMIQLFEYLFKIEGSQEELKEGGEDDDNFQQFVRKAPREPSKKRKRKKMLTVQ